MPRGYPKTGRPRGRPPTCAVCNHPERERIEIMKAAGVSLDKISAKFNVHRDSLHRHWHRHVTDARKQTYLIGPAKFQELSDVAAEESGSVLDHLKVLRSILMAALSNSAKEGHYGELATLSSPLLKCLKQLGEVTGEIASIASTITINNSHTTILASPPFTCKPACFACAWITPRRGRRS